jgi:hypothetical protein
LSLVKSLKACTSRIHPGRQAARLRRGDGHHS